MTAERLIPPAAWVLVALLEGCESAEEVRTEAGTTRQGITQHLTRLADVGLVVDADRDRDAGTPIAPILWSLSPAGRRMALLYSLIIEECRR